MADVLNDPRARHVLEELGIDHCCGAHLTLTQAAAAAGIAPAEVRRRLDLAVGRPVQSTITLDVRGFEPPQPLVRVLEHLEMLRADERLEMIHDRKPQLLYPQLDARGFLHETTEPEPGVVRVLITRAPKTG
jgi:uncharacterized protein (DUF2249 family)